MKPYDHAKNSVRIWGGKIENYLPIHDLLDLPKIAHPDMRHRSIMHNAMGVMIAEMAFGPFQSFLKADGTVANVATRAICERHILEDVGFLPTVADYLESLVLQDWMTGPEVRSQHIYFDNRPTSLTVSRRKDQGALAHATDSVARWGGIVENYMPVHTLLDQTGVVLYLGSTVKARALLHHSLGCFLAERAFGTNLTTSHGRQVSVRDVCERHIIKDVGYIPTVHDWLTHMPMLHWLGGPQRKSGAHIKLEGLSANPSDAPADTGEVPSPVYTDTVTYDVQRTSSLEIEYSKPQAGRPADIRLTAAATTVD